MPSYNSVIDYIIYDQSQFSIKQVIPLPAHEKVIQYQALPSRIIPSDHLAIIFDFQWNLIS
jgi:2',5'-phosphodiesterase